MSLRLKDHQLKALSYMKNGCILNGGVGSGKSLTALSYYYLKQGGSYEFLVGNEYEYMNDDRKNLYIITTARKRDTLEWDKELSYFLLSSDGKYCAYKSAVIIDSWNNIKKYKDVENAFFMFDEQKLVGNGTWVKTFLKIAKVNEWILLSATPGDTWSDYMPVFIANGFFKNMTEFKREHVIYSSFTKFPKIERYIGEKRLARLRNDILVDMSFERHTVRHNEVINVEYDTVKYKDIMKYRWDKENNIPIGNASKLCYELRKIVNSDISRQMAVLEILEKRDKAIIFYNFDYELEILRNLHYKDDFMMTEYNGHKHEEIPKSNRWVYLVQYTSGCEGWNCIETDTIIFFSQTYSYKVLEQAMGRIDRMNTDYVDLYYYHLRSKASIDLGITRALKNKKKFNERKFVDI